MGLITAARVLAEPLIFAGYSLATLPVTALRLLRRGQFGTLLSWSKFQDAWFGAFWVWAGPRVRKDKEADVVPLVQGRVRGGRILSEEEAAAERASSADGDDGGVYGTVLEVGPGSGMWVGLWSSQYMPTAEGASATGADGGDGDSSARQRVAKAAGGPSRVARVYGVEPNPDQHPGLRRRVKEAGLDGVYEIVPVGIEDLAKSGAVQKESVDCVVTVMCLCSIPDPEFNIKELYGYLKKGGRWYVYEHVKCQHGWAMALYQGRFPFSDASCQPAPSLTTRLRRFSRPLLACAHGRLQPAA